MTILNKGQQFITDEAMIFDRDPNRQVFQYAGEAGTGKSVVMYAIAERLRTPMHRIAPMAYSGQAAIVMRTKGFLNAKTIHSWLKTPEHVLKLDSQGRPIYDPYLNRPVYETDFGYKPLDNIDYIFIDEGGTAPYNMKADILSRGKKIFVAGDLGQLPPVGDKPAFLADGKVYYLDQVMRQRPNSNLLTIAKMARNGIDIPLGFYGDCWVIDEDDLNMDMILGSDLVVCGTNKKRDQINKSVRETLGFKTELPQRGERVICRKNNWRLEVDNINLTNGLMGIVTNSPGVDGFDGKTFTMDFQPLLLNMPFIGLQVDYNYFTAPYEQKKYLKNDKFSYGEKFEFAYASTTHLAQGAEVANCIYIEEYLSPEIQCNLNYTGATRAKNSLIYVKRKRHFWPSKMVARNAFSR